MPDANLDRNVTELEAALKGLAPATAHLSRDLLLFRAGQASVRRPTWVWPTAAVLAVAVVVLGTFLSLRPGPTVITRTIVVNRPLPVPAPPPQERPAPAPVTPNRLTTSDTVVWTLPPDGYLRRREEVLRWGVDALPTPSTAANSTGPARPMTAQDLSEWLPEEKSSPSPGGSL